MHVFVCLFVRFILFMFFLFSFYLSQESPTFPAAELWKKDNGSESLDYLLFILFSSQVTQISTHLFAPTSFENVITEVTEWAVLKKKMKMLFVWFVIKFMSQSKNLNYILKPFKNK